MFQRRTTRLTEAEFTAVMEIFDKAVAEAEAAHDDDDPEGRFWQIDLVAADDTI